jgi:hypothetical protein
MLRLTYTAAVVVACVLAVAAAFLPWFSLDARVPLLGSLGTITRYGYEGDGIITLLLGVLAVGCVAFLWREGNAAAFRLVTLFNAFLGAIIFATALVNLSDSERGLGDAQSQLDIDLSTLVGVDLQSLADTGEGIYVAIAAGTILAVASLGAFAAHRFPLAAAAGPQGLAACPACSASPPAGASYCSNCGQRLR